MFVYCQKFAGCLRRDFVGNRVVALQFKTITLFNVCWDELWKLIQTNNEDSTELQVCPSTQIKCFTFTALQLSNMYIIVLFFSREMTLYENCCTKLCGFLGCLTAKLFHKAVSTDSQRKYMQCTHGLIYTLCPSGSQDFKSFLKLINLF